MVTMRRLCCGWMCVLIFMLLGCGDGEMTVEGSGGPDGGGSGGGGGTPPDPVDEGPPPDTLEACGTFTPGNDLNVCTATYLGGPGADGATGVDLASDGTVVVAATVPEGDFGASPVALLGGGDGALLRMAPTGGEVRSVSRLPGPIADLEVVVGTDRIAVGGPALGVALLSPDASEVIWSATPGEVRRVSAGSDGHVAALVGKTVHVYDAEGNETGSFTLDDGHVEDLAVYGPGSSVVVTGFNQVADDLQQPFLRANAYGGEVLWSAYGWSAAEAGELSSDTRGYVVAIGRDNHLYYGGESHGGVTTHFRDPQDLSKEAPIVRYDAHNQSHNWNGAAPLAFYARFNPESGEMLLGQLIAPRLSNGKGNGAGIRHIAADEDGTVIVGGSSACCIEDGSAKTINGLPAMPSYAGGGFVLVANQDFSERLVWTTWSGTASGDIAGVAAWGSTMAVVQTHEADEDTGILEGSLVVSQALQPEAAGGESEAHLSVWPSP